MLNDFENVNFAITSEVHLLSKTVLFVFIRFPRKRTTIRILLQNWIEFRFYHI